METSSVGGKATREPVGDFMSVSEFSDALGGLISKFTIYRAINRGEIPCVFIGRRRLIPRDALQRIMEVPTNSRWATSKSFRPQRDLGAKASTPKNSSARKPQVYDAYWYGRSEPVAVPHDG